MNNTDILNISLYIIYYSPLYRSPTKNILNYWKYGYIVSTNLSTRFLNIYYFKKVDRLKSLSNTIRLNRIDFDDFDIDVRRHRSLKSKSFCISLLYLDLTRYWIPTDWVLISMIHLLYVYSIFPLGTHKKWTPAQYRGSISGYHSDSMGPSKLIRLGLCSYPWWIPSLPSA